MRLTYILAVAVVATLHSSAMAFSSVKDSKTATENGAVLAVDSATAEGGRMLRGEYGNDALIADDDFEKKKAGYGDDALDDDDLDDDDLDDDFGEERTFGDVLKKLNPVKAVKKSAEKTAEHAAKVKEALKDAGDYQAFLAKAKEMVNKD